MNTAPPSGALAAPTEPPCCSATWRDDRQAEPAALPPARARAAVEAVEHVRQVLGRRCRGRGRGRGRRRRRRDLDRAAARRMAGGVVEQVVDRAAEALGHARRRPPARATGSKRDAGEVAPRARRATPSTTWSSRTSSAVAERQVAAGELDQVADQRAQLLALLDARRRAAARARPRSRLLVREQHLDVRAQARDRRAQLVGGVGDQLALGPDRLVERVARVLEPLEHRVEARRELADLVVGVDVDPAREVLGLADVLRGLRRPRRAARARGGRRAGRARARARSRRANTSTGPGAAR